MIKEDKMEKLYRTILADPPWSYDNKRTGGSLKSGADQKYGTLSVRQIRAIPVHTIAHPDSCLLLWVTMPFLPEGLLVMESWGYKYKTSIIWEKIGRLGMGFWFRCQTEICLVGSKGSMKPFHCQQKNIFKALSPGHSVKPDEFFKLVESFIPDPRLEMFARLRRPGWDVWGDQAPEGSDVPLYVPNI